MIHSLLARPRLSTEAPAGRAAIGMSAATSGHGPPTHRARPRLLDPRRDSSRARQERVVQAGAHGSVCEAHIWLVRNRRGGPRWCGAAPAQGNRSGPTVSGTRCVEPPLQPARGGAADVCRGPRHRAPHHAGSGSRRCGVGKAGVGHPPSGRQPAHPITRRSRPLLSTDSAGRARGRAGGPPRRPGGLPRACRRRASRVTDNQRPDRAGGRAVRDTHRHRPSACRTAVRRATARVAG